MKLNTKSTFLVLIFICSSTLSMANDKSISIAKYMDESVQHLCKDDKISLNFSNAVITKICQNFINSSLITCLNLMNNGLQEIDMDSFNKIPNLTKLFLSNNELSDLFSFGGHEKLEILVMNNASSYNTYNYYNYYEQNLITISGKYPNLKILSIRNNRIEDLKFSKISLAPKLDSASETHAKVTQEIPFPKLKILDLSENHISNINLTNLLGNSLHFLDLHDNVLNFLDLYKIGGNLTKLNLDNNYFKYVKRWHDFYESGLLLAGLKNLQNLSISNNEIQSIERDAFQDTKKLIYLNVSRNNINYLEFALFEKLHFLSILDLSFNLFNSVPHISHKTNISVLYLNHNQIKELNPNTFMQMSNLTTLALGNNEIDEIDVKSFVHLFILEKLDLSWNKLSSLPERWTEHLISLKYLDLSYNKLISLESLSLTNKMPLMEMYLVNSLKYLNIRYFESLPKNLTVCLT